MANETGYFLGQIWIWKEANKGVTPSPVPTAFSCGTMAFSLNRNQRTETTPELGNGGEASKTDTGGEDPAGNMDFKYKAGLMPILLEGVIGGATTQGTATEGVWTSSTSYTEGTGTNASVVTHSGGKLLVAQSTIGAGDSGVTEPDITGLVDGDTVPDNEVTWVVRDALYDGEGSNSQEMLTFGVLAKDHTDQGGGVDRYREFRGALFTSFGLEKVGGNIKYMYSCPMVARSMGTTGVDGYTAPTITETVDIPDNPYKREELCVKLNGVAIVEGMSLSMTIERNVAMDDVIECGQKLETVGLPTVSGNLVIRMSHEQYVEAYNNAEKSLEFLYKKANGDFAWIQLPLVQLLDSPVNYDTARPVELDIPLNAYGTPASKTINYKYRSATNFS